MSGTCELCKKTVNDLRTFDNYWDDPRSAAQIVRMTRRRRAT